MKRHHLFALAACLLLSTAVLAANPAAAATDNLVPAQLAGIWVDQLPGGNAEYLILAGTSFTFFYNNPSSTAVGDISVTGDTITFSNSNRCSGTGIYQWSVTDGVLTFVPLNSDPCPRAQFLIAGTWTRR
jgi:hypothetical protein